MEVPLTANALTRSSATGAQGSSLPVSASMAANRDRATALPLTMASVKSPPT
jgi:hypothetical protein